MDIWILKDGKAVGPFNDEQFKGLLDRGEVNETTLVYGGALTEWRSLGLVIRHGAELQKRQDWSKFFSCSALLIVVVFIVAIIAKIFSR